MNAKVHELLNQQINKEFYSAYLYLDFSNYFEQRGLDGFANWYMIQAQEERDHAMLFYKFLQNESKKVTLEAIGKPDKELDSLMAPLKAGFEHEQYVTSLINDNTVAVNLVFVHNVLVCANLIKGELVKHNLATSAVGCVGLNYSAVFLCKSKLKFLILKSGRTTCKGLCCLKCYVYSIC